jgi:hypothetical protein
MNRTLILVFVLAITHISKGIAQKYDEYYYLRTGIITNWVDSCGQKQGNWILYELKTLKNCDKTFIVKYAQGKFIDDKKTGKWLYGPQHYGCNEFIDQGTGYLMKYGNLLSEIYYKNGDIEVETRHGGYYLSADSLYFKGFLKDKTYVNGKCLEFEKQVNEVRITGKQYTANGEIRFTKYYTDLKKVIEFLLWEICDLSLLDQHVR